MGTVALWLAGCEDSRAVAPAARRVEAVAAAPTKGVDLSAFCDVEAGPEQAKRLAMPPLDGSMSEQAGSWRWINVWATWCRPCIEEMPMLVEWRGRLAQQGRPVDLSFVSVDESAEVLDGFRREHPSIPPSLRLSDHESLEGWVAGMGLDPGATLPLHLFLDPAGRLRCARSGAVDRSHLETVRHLFSTP